MDMADLGNIGRTIRILRTERNKGDGHFSFVKKEIIILIIDETTALAVGLH